MASKKEYLDYILGQLSLLDDVTHKAMMGEYILYYKGRIFGGIYDDRFLVKTVPAAEALMPDAPLETPYDGAKPMLLVDNAEDSGFLQRLVTEMYPQLPEKKKKTKK